MLNMNTNIEVATTIINQMGGVGKLHSVVGAYNFVAIDQGVQFSFKGSKKTNKVVITLTPMDLYNVNFYKINMKDIDKSLIPVAESDMIYADMLIELFEKTTGLYLHFK